MVDLDVLAGGDVALVQRRVLLDDAGEGVHLLRRDPAEGELDPDHLDVGLTLPVDALFEAEADELVLFELAGEELLGFVVEVVELALDDRDDVAGDVLVGLRVGQRPDPAFAPLLLVLRDGYLHGRKVANPVGIQVFNFLSGRDGGGGVVLGGQKRGGSGEDHPSSPAS